MAISGSWLLKGAGGRGSTGGRVHVAGPAQPSGLKVDQVPPTKAAREALEEPLVLLVPRAAVNNNDNKVFDI